MAIDTRTDLSPLSPGDTADLTETLFSEERVAVPVHVRIPAASGYVRVVREMVDCLCQLRSLSEDVRAAVKLAVGEAVNNAVAYARAEDGRPEVDVVIRLHANLLEIEVINESGGFQPETPGKMPDAELLAENGRGLALMNIMMDEVEYFVRDGKTVALMRKWLS
ncbi:MAG: ATP-binding protein [Capsulimonadales bacterium]|nr:ATP-binding protein [Capsulimonadales bacterium]